MLELASIHAERLHDHEAGRKLWEEVLLDEPTNEEALERLEWSYNQNDDWDALIELYNRRVELSVEPDERLELLHKIALIEEEVRNAPEQAVAAYRRVLENDPEDTRASRALERLLRTLGEFEELAILYRRQMDFHTEPDELVELQHRLGLVLERELDRIPDAIDAYRTALEIKPEHPASRRSLETLLRDLGQRDDDAARDYRVQIAMLLEQLYDEETDWENLVEVYEVQLEQVDDPLSSVEILVKQARLFEEHDQTPERAFRAYARAVETSPSRGDVREKLEELAETLDVWSELVPIYLKALEVCEDDHERVSLLLRIAQLNQSELGNTENATLCYQQILEYDPYHQEALDALEQLYMESERYEELVDVLAAKAENIDDVWQRKDVYYRIADLWEELLEQPTEAIDTYRRILEVDEEDQTALDALERLYMRTEQWPALVDIYRRKIELAEDDEDRRRLQFSMATLYDEQIEDAYEAIETYRAILMDHPRDLDAVEALDRLYSQEERWVDLLDILNLELELAEESGDESLRNRTEFRIGRLLQTQMNEVPRAITHYQRILERDPEHAEAFDVLEQLLENEDYRAQAAEVLEPLFEQLGHWDRLVDLYQVKLESIYEPNERRELMIRTSRIQEDMLDKPDMAFMLLGRAVKEFPRDEGVIEHFERLAEMLGTWDEAVAVYEELVESSTDPSLVQTLCLRCARIYEERLGDIEQAINKYQRVLEIDEFHREALANLDRLYQMQERWEDLANVLERRIALGGERDEVLLFRYQLGFLKENVFEDLPGAIECYKNIIWDEPSHEDALSALEGMLTYEEHRREIADVLEPIYTQNEEFGKLYELLQLKMEVIEDPDSRFTLLRRMGELAREQVEDDHAAFTAFALALELMPGDTQLVQEVEQLAERIGNYDELAGALDNAASKVDDPFTRRELNLKIANLCLQKLEDFDAAEAKFLEVLEDDPENADALANLESIYKAVERWEDLLEIYEKRVETTYDEQERKQLLYDSAGVALNTLGDYERGVRYLREVLELDDTDVSALDALETIYEQQGQYDELLGVVERKAELAMEGDEILALRMKIGMIAKEALERPERAIEAFSNALDFDPGNIDILRELEDLYVATERWAELQDNLMRQLSATEEQEQRLMLYMKCAAIASQFGDNNRAIENLQQVLTLDPSNEDALSELERIYAEEGRFEDLKQVLEHQLESAETNEQRISLNIRIAQVAGKLGDTQSAIANLQAVLEMQPDNVQAMDVLAGIYEDQEMYGEALAMLEQELNHTPEPPAQSAILVRCGDILYRAGGDAEQGEAAYSQALELDPSNLDAINALIDLYEQAGDTQSKLRVMEYKVATMEDPEERHDMLFELAETSINELNDYAAAARTLEQAYELKPELDTAEKLLDAYIETGNVEKAQPLLEQIIEQLESSRKMKKLPPFHHLRGKLAMQAGDEAAALEAFQAAYDIDATYLPNLLDLGKYYYHQGEYQDALKTFQTMLLHQMNIKDDAIKVDMYYHLGMVRWRSDDERRARDMFNRALSINSDHEPSKTALEELG